MVEIGQMLILFLEQCFVYSLLSVGIEYKSPSLLIDWW